MEFKGTKGKWEFQKPLWHNQSYEEGLRLFVERGNIQHTLLEVRGWKISKEEVLANALLISKAPEMLEMLKLISEKAELIFSEPDGEDNRFFDEINFEKLDNLIKSATEL